MSFLARLFGRTGTSGGQSETGSGSAPIVEYDRQNRQVFWLYVQCNQCGERLRVRVNSGSDLQQEFAEDGADAVTGYRLDKEILGSNCRALMFVRMTFDGRHNIRSQTAEKCTLLTRAQFESA